MKKHKEETDEKFRNYESRFEKKKDSFSSTTKWTMAFEAKYYAEFSVLKDQLSKDLKDIRSDFVKEGPQRFKDHIESLEAKVVEV